MEASFHALNRDQVFSAMKDNCLAVFFAGKALRKTGDEFYPLFANRNFVYLTGLDREGMVLLVARENGVTRETLYIPQPDALAERWTGHRVTPAEAEAASGIADIRFSPAFEADFRKAANAGRYECLYLDLYKQAADDQDQAAHFFLRKVQSEFPFLRAETASPILHRVRTIKKPCEIQAMKTAAEITKEGIVAMMKASRPGMYEYEYKAEWDRVLTRHGVLEPAFPSIISAGKNNFCIHYYDYRGQARDGDMVLNDVGAQWDNCHNDVSRGWPVNGVYSEKQRLLYRCAYNTSLHMFSIIRPGMLMKDVDRLAREYNYEQLHDIGLCASYDDIGTYMWHGGAHHVGYDTHDQVVADGAIRPGMVFCVDIGIYCEAWGIGFRVEDNCHVTENGCENLTACVPKTMEDIEDIMRK